MVDHKRGIGKGQTGSEQHGAIGAIHALSFVPGWVMDHIAELDCHVWGFDIGTNCIGLTVLRSKYESFSTCISPCCPQGSPWYIRGASMMLALHQASFLFTTISMDSTRNLVVGLEIPPVYGKHGNVALKLGDIRGMIMGTIISRYGSYLGSKLFLFANIMPQSVKHAITGDGLASKKQVLAAAQKLNPNIVLEDEADSIGIALATLYKYHQEGYTQCQVTLKNTKTTYGIYSA